MNELILTIESESELGLGIESESELSLGVERSAGTTNYNALTNKPRIEGHTLVGDSTIQQIGVDALPVSEIEKILYL